MTSEQSMEPSSALAGAWRWFVTGIPPSLGLSPDEHRAFLQEAKQKFGRDIYLLIAMVTGFNIIYWFTDAWLLGGVDGALEAFSMGRATMVLIAAASWVLHSLFPQRVYLIGTLAGGLALFYIGRVMGLIGPPSSPWFHFLYPFQLIVIGQWLSPWERAVVVFLLSMATLSGYFSAQAAWLLDPLLGVSLGYFAYVVVLSYLVGLYVDYSKAQHFATQRDLRLAQTHLEARIEERTQALQALVAHMDHARDEERSRLARDLHDEVGQLLTAQRLAMKLAKRRYSKNHAAIGPNLDQLDILIDDVTDQFREVLRGQRLRILDELGLEAALQHLAKLSTKKLKLPCELHIEPIPLNIGQLEAVTVYRCLQEGITNAAKHASATEVKMAVVVEDHRIMASVTDNGIGIGSSSKGPGAGFGLLGARERLSALNGTLDVRSLPEGGTRLQLNIPARERVTL